MASTHYIAHVATVHSFYGSEFEAACSFLDGFLASRTFLVGYSLSIADIVLWSNIARTGQRWESLRRSKKYQNLIRWFNSIAVDYAGRLDEVVAAFVGKRGIGKSPTPSLEEKVQDSKLDDDEEINISNPNLNPCTRREALALGDPNMRNLKQGEIVQLERKGYYRCDVPFIRPAKPIVLFLIPDGRQQSAANK